MDEQAQDQDPDLDLELTEEEPDFAPPGAFYAALCNALKQLERQPVEARPG